LVANPHSTVKNAYAATVMTSVLDRPSRSAMMPATAPPIALISSVLVPSRPAWVLVRPK
jgi:hypothetical protein